MKNLKKPKSASSHSLNYRVLLNCPSSGWVRWTIYYMDDKKREKEKYAPLEALFRMASFLLKNNYTEFDSVVKQEVLV